MSNSPWGSGLKRITKLCKDCTPGFRPLEIKELGDIIRFNIYRPKAVSVPDDTMNDTINEEVPNNDTINRTGKNSEKTTQKILELMQTDPTISIDELATKCNLSRDGINYNIKSLKNAGLIEREGAKKNGKWIVKELHFN